MLFLHHKDMVVGLSSTRFVGFPTDPVTLPTPLCITCDITFFVMLSTQQIIVHRLKPPAKKISKQKEKTSSSKKKKKRSKENENEDEDDDDEDEDDCNVLFPCNRWFAKGMISILYNVLPS